MAIYGINFNGTRIPDDASKKFAKRLKHRHGKLVRVSNNESCDYILQGVCNDDAEYQRMHIQADNGHRQIMAVRRGKWIGVYCG